jgi:CDP-glucose 4,6-dehydratase
MNRRFWSGKRAFVTGHTGFKGGWLCAWLLEAGATVTGYALAPSTRRSVFVDCALERDMRSVLADVRDRDTLDRSLRDAAPDVIFHLAAQPLVRESYERPIETFSVNVLGTAHVLDAVRAVPSARAVLVATSDKCYESTNSDRRHVEEDALGGSDPYSASKACAEIVASAFRRSFLNGAAGVATTRAGNVIGGGDYAKDRLLPDLLRAFESGVPAQIRRPEAVRPWQHVADPISGYMRLAECLYEEPDRFAGAWNFGPPPEHEVSVATLADMAASAWGAGAAWTTAAGSHPHETEVLRLDSAKAARSLNWRARVPLDSAVTWTIEWHREGSSGGRARELLRRDLARFEQVLR